jgi:hypothetical protein
MDKIGSVEGSSSDSPRKQRAVQASRNLAEAVDSTGLACSVDLGKIKLGSD